MSLACLGSLWIRERSPPIAVVALALLALLPGPTEAQAPGGLLQPPKFDSGFYSVEQAARGRESFVMICEECHSSSEFRGDDFEWTWRRQTVWNFYRELIQTMPEDSPGALSEQTYADVIAYILQINEYSAGDSELTATEEAMDVIALGPGAPKSPTPQENKQ